MKKFPLNIAHRGASSSAPENTMPAFERAIKDHCDCIELDVHLSHDNIPVVIHDETLNRTTNGYGRVSDFTVCELKKLDAGKYFSKEFINTKIPTLEEVFKLVVKYNTSLDIEIKQSTGYIEKKVIDLIFKYNYENKVIITSFNPKSLVTTKKLCPNIETGLLFFLLQRDPIDSAKKINANALCANFNFVNTLNKEYIKKISDNNLKLFTFTVNKKSDMVHMIKKNADGIITNNPYELYKLKTNPFKRLFYSLNFKK